MKRPFSYTVIRSSRKTVVIQIKSGGTVVIRCPRFTKQADIDRILDEKSPWILSNLQKFSQADTLPCFTPAELDLLKQRAKAIIPARVKILSEKTKISYNRISIRSQRTRWGSCSSKGNLNFNCLLVLTPPEVMDYVIIHELCHRVEMNHSSAFWEKVRTYCPDYMTHRHWLKAEGANLVRRLPK